VTTGFIEALLIGVSSLRRRVQEMKKNDLFRIDDAIFRVLDLNRGRMLLIDCCKQTMPQWATAPESAKLCMADELYRMTGFTPAVFEALSSGQQRVAHERFTTIAPVLAYIGDVRIRGGLIRQMAGDKLSPQTVRQWLCRYLAYQDIAALAPAAKVESARSPSWV
jgi:hypothetical protein